MAFLISEATTGSSNIEFFRNELLRHLGEQTDAYPLALEEQFPHILAHMADLWGTEHMANYLQGLIISDRPRRRGFPPEVIMEIYRIYEIHSNRSPAIRPPSGNRGRTLHVDLEWGK